jgi:hypothetical protein
LVELYTEAASQAPGIQEDLFLEIEGLELQNGGLSTFSGWRDREAEVRPVEVRSAEVRIEEVRPAEVRLAEVRMQ